MSILDLEVIKKFALTCNDGYEQGWHEGNGGNLSYRMTAEEVEACKPYFTYDRPWVDLGVQADNLKKEYFMVTGTGENFSRTLKEILPQICVLLEIDDAGDGYRIVWGLVNGGGPTSEFPTHFMNHSVRVEATDGACRVIYHAHPVNIIALTFVLPLTSEAFSRVLWESMTECPIIFPNGVGVVEWMIPGGAEIAHKTCELQKKYDAIVWAHHGLFVSGNTFDAAFGLMHTIEKSAEIYCKVLSTGKPIAQTIPDEGLINAATAYGKKLNAELLK